MTRETKAGLVVSCSFLCLVGVVLFSKLNDKEASGTESPSEGALAKMMEEPRAVPTNTSGPAPGNAPPSPAERHHDDRKTPEPTGVVPAEYRPGNEQGNSKPLPGPAASPQDPASKERPAPSPSPVNNPNESPPSPIILGQVDSPLVVNPTPSATPSGAMTGNGIHSLASAEPAAPGVSQPNPVKSAPTTSNTAITAASGLPASAATFTHAGEPSDPAGEGTKPVTPSFAPTGPGPSLVAHDRAVPTKPPLNGAPTPTSTPSPGLHGVETPKPTETPKPREAEAMPTQAIKGLPTTESTTKRDAPALTQTPTDRPKTTPSDITWSRDPRPAVGFDQKSAGAGTDYRAPGTTEGTSATGPVATPPPSSFGSGSSDTPPRSTFGLSPRSSAGLSGSTQDFPSRQGSNGGIPAMGSSSTDRDKAFMQEAAPFRPNSSPAPVDGGIDRRVQLGSPAVAPQQSGQTMQTPPAATPVFSSGGSSPTRPLPPLGAPAAAVSAPLAVSIPSGSSPSSPGGILQVESYDERTYTCKQGDTLRMISQQFYDTDQYDRALLLFNRNHPLATDALRQEPPTVQAGLALYIPPSRILQKYYGAPVINSTPVAPLPPARPFDRPSTVGPAPRTNSYLAPPSITIKPLPPPGSVPLYRVHEGGEMLAEIAGHTLGYAGRWTEIFRLNPRLYPKEPVPGGSEIRLPRDAHVAPQDIP